VWIGREVWRCPYLARAVYEFAPAATQSRVKYFRSDRCVSVCVCVCVCACVSAAHDSANFTFSLFFWPVTLLSDLRRRHSGWIFRYCIWGNLSTPRVWMPCVSCIYSRPIPVIILFCAAFSNCRWHSQGRELLLVFKIKIVWKQRVDNANFFKTNLFSSLTHWNLDLERIEFNCSREKNHVSVATVSRSCTQSRLTPWWAISKKN